MGRPGCCSGHLDREYAFGKIHLGARLEDGIVDVSLDTVRKAAALVQAETRDAVSSWLNPAFLGSMADYLEEKAGVPVKDAKQVVETVSKQLSFSEDEQEAVFEHFLAGGQRTAGGLMQAVSSVAQTIDDPDEAFRVERLAVQAMDLAVVASS